MNGYNGVYTLANTTTGEHRTFAVRTQAEDADFRPGERIAALLTGPDNEADYTGFGFVTDAGIRVWRKRQGGAFDHYGRMLQKAIAAVAGDGEVLSGTFDYAGRRYSVQLAKRCLRCNRRLTTPESIARGYGPECAEKLGLA